MELFHPLSFILLASLLTGIKGQCETELGNLATCKASLIETEDQACIICLDVLDVSTVTPCDELEIHICGWLSGCGTTCGTCIDELESVFDCVLSDCGGYNCGTGGSGGSSSSGGSITMGTAVLGSFFTVSLGLSSLLLM